MVSLHALRSSINKLSTPKDFPFIMAATAMLTYHEVSIADLLGEIGRGEEGGWGDGSECSPEPHCHYNFIGCIFLSNVLYICCESRVLL